MPSQLPYVIACAVLALDIKRCAQEMGLKIKTRFLEAGLHEKPALLRQKLQQAIDDISTTADCQRIIIGYGVCGRGSAGIQARDKPLNIARVHDCIALFLGGDAQYKAQFKKYPGTFYISAGWYEEKTEPLSQRRQWAYYGDQKLHYNQVKRQYGAPAADATFRFLNAWQQNYQRAVFIETGSGSSARYEKYARDLAAEHDWRYEKIQGDRTLIQQLLTATHTDDHVLVVPPRHIIEFDALHANLSANPIWGAGAIADTSSAVQIVDAPQSADGPCPQMNMGLGIDAGGTYTDAVVYDLAGNRTISKAKALTTKYDFSIGIGRALAKLDRQSLDRIDMVALSTTLATNAIVEGEGQKVGLMLMPAFDDGLDKNDIGHQPCAVVDGRMKITGEAVREIDEAQVRQIARRMVVQDQIKAFAVSGFAGAINPAHELKVKQIITRETGLSVTCGHELSDILDFKVRAQTAVFNARIIPRLTQLLQDMQQVLETWHIAAPIVVVKGDGTLMSAAWARQRPVETILSGPAASVAGARHLTGLKNALVVDMGGTTSDTAELIDGAVSVCDRGSRVGGRQTHVRALDIRTSGLGGDSLIQWEKGRFSIGPRRVAPVCWMGAACARSDRALDFFQTHLNRFATSTTDMQILALTGSADQLQLTEPERQIVHLLACRPHAMAELVQITGALYPAALPIKRLEAHAIVQRCGLTPTDLLHVTGQFSRWDARCSQRLAGLFAAIAKQDVQELARHLLTSLSRKLAIELLKHQLHNETEPDAMDDCPVCQTLLQNLMSGGNDRYRVRLDFNQPIVGIGAPIHYFLNAAADILGAQAVVPQHADVANAIGAITSHVEIKRQLRIVAHTEGGFVIDGLAGAPHFSQFEAADTHARQALVEMVRSHGRAAGTSAGQVKLHTQDRIPTTADGRQIFIERLIQACLRGKPDRVFEAKDLPGFCDN